MSDLRLQEKSTHELLHEDGHFKLLIENFNQFAFITLDRNGFIQNWDGGAQAILQYSKEEILGKSGSIFFNEYDVSMGEDQNEMETALDKGFAEDERWHGKRTVVQGQARTNTDQGIVQPRAGEDY